MTDFDGKAMLDALREDPSALDAEEAVKPAKTPARKRRAKPKADTRKRSATPGTKPTQSTPQSSEGVTTPSTPSEQPARRGMARQLERSGRCPMYVPLGTTCKTCGKVHPHD